MKKLIRLKYAMRLMIMAIVTWLPAYAYCFDKLEQFAPTNTPPAEPSATIHESTVIIFDVVINGNIDSLNAIIQTHPESVNTTLKGYTPLIVAAIKNNLLMVHALLQAGAHTNVRDNKGSSIITLALFAKQKASLEDHCEIIRLLVAYGASIHERSPNGSTMLMCAVLGGHIETIQLLMNAGISVNDHNENGDTALSFALSNGNVPVVDFLLRNGARLYNPQSTEQSNGMYSECTSESVMSSITSGSHPKDTVWVGVTPLMIAAMYGHVPVVQYLLNKSLSTGIIINKTHRDGATALMLAAQNGHVNVIDELVRCGADVNQKNKYGYTAFLSAVMNGHVPVAQRLLQAGAHLHDGGNDLILASRRGHTQMVQFLLSCGVQPNARETGDFIPNRGYTALMVAAQEGNLETVRFLLQSGAEINAQDFNGNTVLMLACLYKSSDDVVQYLLENGADVNSCQKYSKTTAMIWAAKNGYLRKVQLLVEAGARVNDQEDDNGNTPLISAARYGHTEVVGYLLEQGAHLKGTRKYGHKSKKALIMAARHGHTETVRLLLEWVARTNDHRHDYKNKALLAATAYGKTSTIALLRQHGATTNPFVRFARTLMSQ